VTKVIGCINEHVEGNFIEIRTHGRIMQELRDTSQNHPYEDTKVLKIESVLSENESWVRKVTCGENQAAMALPDHALLPDLRPLP